MQTNMSQCIKLPPFYTFLKKKIIAIQGLDFCKPDFHVILASFISSSHQPPIHEQNQLIHFIHTICYFGVSLVNGKISPTSTWIKGYQTIPIDSMSLTLHKLSFFVQYDFCSSNVFSM